MPRPDSEEFEKLIHRTLRSLPDRRAPRSLELRVLVAIEARQSLPWWRQSFAHWPHAAQAVFLLLSGVIAAILVTLVFRTGAEVEAASPWTSAMSNLRHARLVLASLGEACAAVFRGIPPLWLYGGLAFLAAMYAALVGLGAAAYRTFFHHR